MFKISFVKLWKRKSFKLFIALIIIILIIIPFSLSTSNTMSNDDVNKISKFDNGSTVFAGDNVLDKNNLNKYPIVSNLGYFANQLQKCDFIGAFFSIATGAVPTPSTNVLEGNVTDDGEVEGFDGPGHIVIEDGKIKVLNPDSLIYGYTTPYTQAVKTEDGIDIINNKTGEIIKHVNANDISNDTVGTDRVSGYSVSYWYNTSIVGSKYNLDYAVGGISDNRSLLTPSELKENFEEAYNYSLGYPGSAAIILYEENVTEKKVSTAYTYLGSHPEYNDANRELNARQFVEAWNNTIIPANVSGCGRENISFSSVAEADAASGMAAHGVCPPARALRNAVLNLGFSLPVGMDTGEDAVLYGYSPSTGIRITNTLDHPIRITMWTDGSGTGMGIGANIYELVPNNESNSTNYTNYTN